jgi:hypothetical protein
MSFRRCGVGDRRVMNALGGAVRQPTDHRVEDWSQEQAEEGDAEHAGEHGDAHGLSDFEAGAVGSMAGGSLIAWAVMRQGTAAQFVRRDLQTLLAPYKTRSRR